MKNPSANIVAKYGTKEFTTGASIIQVRKVLATYNRKLKIPKTYFTIDRFGSWKMINDFIKQHKLDYEEIKNKYNSEIDREIMLKKQTIDYKQNGRHKDIPILEKFKL